MQSRDCLNQDNNILYILHFPGNGIDGHEYIVSENLHRHIELNDNISIISIMDRNCYNTSPLVEQCNFNNIPIYNGAINENSWNNTKKINYILEDLDTITTEYALILDGRDVIITHDLDNEFLKKVNSFESPIVYNGTPAAYPDVPIESIREIVTIDGKQKYLNAGVCIGRVDALKKAYNYALDLKNNMPDNNSEQLIIRKVKHTHPDLITHDSKNAIFRIVHQYDTKIEGSNSSLIFI